MIYAYARVSSADQNLSRQLDSFTEFGVDPNNVFTDKKSGKNFERQSYALLLEKLQKGDLLVVKSIDRLGRNYEMIIEEWARINKKIGADIVVLDMPLLDTREHDGDLTGKFISDLVLQILSYVAEKERENIRARQREGIESARERGVKFGRPRIQTPDNFDEVIEAYLNNEISYLKALALSGLTRSTFYRRLN